MHAFPDFLEHVKARLSQDVNVGEGFPYHPPVIQDMQYNQGTLCFFARAAAQATAALEAEDSVMPTAIGLPVSMMDHTFWR
ncbi:hypothetical protein [Arthrobacter sp. SD76]|uniref:hypothetical protein n=1 Tax=Arthrobacter sp. SD76 TaxID=3415007 RepID=UPI003C710883